MPLSIDLAEHDKIVIVCGDGDCEDETIERSPSKNLNGITSYLISKTRLAFNKLRKAFTKTPIF